MTRALLEEVRAKDARPLPTWTVTHYYLDTVTVQARNKAAAVYAAFKLAREAGFFCHRNGFREYLLNALPQPSLAHLASAIEKEG